MEHSHLVWTFSPQVEYFHLTWAFSFCIDILTSCGAFSLCVGHFYLTCTLHGRYLTCSVPPLICKSSCVHPTMAANISFGVLPACKNNIFHIEWKNSLNSNETTSIPSLRLLYEPPIKRFMCCGSICAI